MKPDPCMMIGIILKFESGEDLVVEWKIENFFNLPKEDGHYYRSPDFTFGSEEWCLGIWPNGFSNRDSSGHVDLELVKCRFNRSIKQSFSLSLKTAKGEKYNEEHCTRDFGIFYPETSYHEILRFTPRLELDRRISELMPEGVLTVVCTMKNSTSTGSSKTKSLEAKSEIDVLKLNYNQALQDKAEAQTKLRVLTNNFKDKEIQLQRQLSAKEDDVNSAKRRIMFIEQENASYKSQVAKLEQVMEEKERTLKSQIAACTAESNLENMEQEITQLRQRLTLLEREQENWAKAATDEIVRPVPKTCVEASTQTVEERYNTASTSAECCHCKGTFNADSLSSHQKKCMHRPTKCPDCLEVVVLEKWLNEHDCQQERPEGEACASGSSISSHEKKLHDDLKELFLKKEDCDVIIKVKGSEIPAHRVILKARSPVFASTFQHNMKENATSVVEIEDSDPSPFMDFLNYVYCGDIGMISQENVFDLFRLADKYEVLDLKATCLEFMKKNITVDTFCETITMALQHSEIELTTLATDFFVRNAEEILQTIKWQTFAAENPTQSNELIIKLVKWFKHSNV